MRHLRRPVRPSPAPRALGRARPSPREREGAPRPPPRGRQPPPHSTASALGPAGANREARPEESPPRPSPFRGRPGARGAPAGPAPASRAAPRQAGPPPGRASREAANMAPSVTQPPPSVTAGHTHTRSSGKRPRRARSSKFAFRHPTAFPRRPRGPAGAKELIPARSLPPSTPARPPSPSEPASCALLRAGAGEPAARAPQVATITCKSSGGRQRPTGVLLTAAGVRFLSSRWILLFMSMFPSSPLFKLNFPRRGRRGERRPGLRSEGRRKGSAGGRGRRCGPRHGRRAG